MTRELIYSTLFDLWKSIPGIITYSRRLVHWSDVVPESQPALYQIQKGERAIVTRGVPTKWELSVDIYVYTNVGNDINATPAIALNPILDGIEAVLLPDPATGFQTLGGLVSHAWIDGEIETSEGALGPQEVAIVPIRILTAGGTSYE
jgi:hypothetical protein